MNIRERFIEILGKYWWVLLIIVGIGYFFTDIPIFKYIIFVVAIPFALMIFLPFIIQLLIQLFSPAFVLVSSLIEHFREAESMPFGKKYIFIPMALVSAISFSTAQMILSIWVLIFSLVAWGSVIGFFWTFLLTFLFGLAPIVILITPFLVWYKGGFTLFLGTGIFFLMTLFWFGFSKLAFSEDYSSTPEDFLGYSPQIFLLGALSFQVLALPFYQFKIVGVGNVVSDLGGAIFLFLALISVFKWRSLKKKLSKEEKEYLYRPSVWVYILGFFFTNILYVVFQKFEAPTVVISWLNLFFLVALIERFFGFFRRKSKDQEIKQEYELDYEEEITSSEIIPITSANDIQQEISIWETRISEKEREVSDLSIQVQDIKIALNIFLDEYNSRVGLLYVKLDKIKLKIKEYQLRIKLAQDKKVSQEDLETIEEEVNETFSQERHKIDDLENEIFESSEEYSKHLEEEKTCPLDDESRQECKALYRKLARKFHPDMAKDSDQRKEFHKIFVAINEAYKNGDLEILKKYMEQAEQEEKIDRETPEDKLNRLKEEYKVILGVLARLRAEIEDLKEDETYKLKERVDQAKKEGRDLLQQLANEIKEEIAENQIKLDKLVAQYKEIAGGIID